MENRDQENSDGSAGGHLQAPFCAQCSTIKFSEALSAPDSYVGSAISGELRPAEGSDGELICPVCRMIAAVVPGRHHDLVFRLRLEQPERRYRNHLFLGPLLEPFHFDLEIRYPPLDSWPHPDAIAVFTDHKENHETLENAKEKLQNPSVDFTILRKWIDTCDRHHLPSCAKSSAQEAAGMHLIDVESRMMVEVSGPVEYAALSYVWGQGAHGTVADTNSLPNPAPNTIEDAMKVTKELGLKYLWVDRYCISQHNKTHKQSQIEQMHLIYNNAFVTIIAACGNGPEHGLPGVDGRPRPSESFAVIDGRLLVAMRPPPGDFIDESVWASRGWTYQEAVLSRRRLFFTDHHVYFVCNHPSLRGVDNAWHQLLATNPRDLEEPRTPSQDIINLPTGHNATSSPGAIFRHIGLFSARTLSFEGDRLNAFQGILQDFTKAHQIDGHAWGIPIRKVSSKIASSTADFFVSLYWRHLTPSKRYDRFPSWSWLGWEHEVLYDLRPNMRRVHDSTFCKTLSIHFELVEGGKIDVDQLCERCQRGDVPRLSRFIQLELPILEFYLEYSGTVPGLEPLMSIGWRAVGTLNGTRFSSVVWLDIDIQENPHMSTRLLTEKWSGLVLEQESSLMILMLGEDGGYSERIGRFEIQPDELYPMVAFQDLVLPVQKIRLG